MKKNHKIITLSIILLGIILILFSFFYEVYFAGIPYQDPPENIYKIYKNNQKISKGIYFSGIIITILGIISYVTLRIKDIKRKNH